MERFLTGTMGEWAKNAGHYAFNVFMRLFVNADANGAIHDTTVTKMAKMCGVSPTTIKTYINQLEDDRLIARTWKRGSSGPYTVQIIDFEALTDKQPTVSEPAEPPETTVSKPQSPAVPNPPAGNVIAQPPSPAPAQPKPTPEEAEGGVQVESFLKVEFELSDMRINKIIRQLELGYIMSAIVKTRPVLAANPEATPVQKEALLLNELYGGSARPVADNPPPQAPPGPPAQVRQPAPEVAPEAAPGVAPPQPVPPQPGFDVVALMQKIDAGRFISPAEYELVPQDIKAQMLFDQPYHDQTREYRYYLPKG